MCRVPADIQHLFPHPNIYKSLKTSNEKMAIQLATVLEYQTQKLFFQIRTGMLDPNINKSLIAHYLNDYITFIENDVKGYVPSPQESEKPKVRVYRKKIREQRTFSLELLDDLRSNMGMGRENFESVQNWSDYIDTRLKVAKESLALRKTDSEEFWTIVNRRISRYNSRVKKKKDKLFLSDDEKKQLYMDFLKAEIQLLEVQKAAAIGELAPFENLKKSVTADLSECLQRNISFSTVIDAYKNHYEKSNPDVKIGTIKDMKSECEVLLDIIGDINIDKVNTLKTVTLVKDILAKYPRNKKQIFGVKSIHDILKTNSNFVIISRKTANEPIKRFSSIIDFAIKSEYVLTANKVIGELFKIDKQNKPRKSYDKNDIEKLIDALCSQPLWIMNPPRNDRFWVILIALFHGFRLGNIVNLTKKHIINDNETGWPCFDLRMFKEEDLLKTKSASMLVPIHGVLLLMGFMEWVNKNKAVRLFSDTTSTFSKWYNRRDKHYLGFETRYVTDDPDKCLHSTRHYFSNELRKSGIEHKLIQEMMGHARQKSDVTSAYYLDRAEISIMKDVHDKMQLDGIDFDRLEARAKELFDLLE